MNRDEFLLVVVFCVSLLAGMSAIAWLLAKATAPSRNATIARPS